MQANDLKGRRVVITGAGRGLGRALAISTADRGADVVLLGRDEQLLKGVAATIRDRTSQEANIFVCDLAKSESVAEACELTLAQNPVVDVLINNAAPWLSGDLESFSDAEICDAISATVMGTILITKGLLCGLERSGGADIVTVVSTSGYPGWDSGGASSVFHAAKHAQSGFSDRLRAEVRHKRIRVSAIYPPDFDDVDSFDSIRIDAHHNLRLINRDVVDTVLFVITASRACSFPVVIMDGAHPQD